MAHSLLDSLNPKQKEAVTWCEGPELVLAGAGSGKTKVLTTKIAYLIEEKGVAPHHILALTFTNKAAREMRDRVEQLVQGRLLGMQVSTFHAYGLRFLHRHRLELERLGYPGAFVIFDTSDVKSLVKRLMTAYSIDPKRFDVSWVIGMISKAKSEADPATLKPDIDARWFDLYQAYHKELKKQGALDFDDLLTVPLHILTVDNEVREQERSRVDWVLVDEYQDVNRTQYLLLNRLIGESRRIMVVGDPDQSIYGWRGADMGMILNFEHDFPQSKVVVLDQNYRSTGNILAGANGVIRYNSDRLPKDLWTAADMGRKVQILMSRSDREESSFLVDEVERLHDEGYAYGEMALLYRMNALSRGFEQVFLERGIPYRVVRGVAFYERREVKDVLCMLRLAVNPRDWASLARVGNIPIRGLGKVSLENLGNWLSSAPGTAREIWQSFASEVPLKGKAAGGAVKLGADMCRILDHMQDIPGAIECILTDNGYADYLLEETPEDWEERVENVRELLSILPEEGDIAEVLSEVALFTDMELAVEDRDRVNLLTLHAAKGLEYPIVFLVVMEEGIFPSARCMEDAMGLSEERRLCYVGMTRARERLYLSGAESRLLFGGFKHASFSRFLSEVPEDCCQTEDKTGGGNPFVRDSVNRRRWSW